MVPEHTSVGKLEDTVLRAFGFVLTIPIGVSFIQLQGVIAEVKDASGAQDPKDLRYYLPLAGIWRYAG